MSASIRPMTGWAQSASARPRGSPDGSAYAANGPSPATLQRLAGLGGDAATLFSGAGVAVPLVEQATRLEFAGGLTFKIQPNLSFYAQAGYQFAVSPSDARRNGVKGDIGLRYTW
jgi:hypothetical protein